MKTRFYAFVAAVAAALLTSCEREPVAPVDNNTYPFQLSVLNSDYTETISLPGVGPCQIAAKTNLPAWIRDVYLTGETNEKGQPLLGIDVQGDQKMDEQREATVRLEMTNGSTVQLDITQWPSFTGGVNGEELESSNTAFERKWYEAEEIDLVLSFKYINGRPEVVKERVPLPWATDLLPQQHLPRETLSRMMAFKEDWALVFNLTGIDPRPGYNYFGLYNKYLGILRIFYYFTKDRLPSSDANDHMWIAELDKSLAEHGCSQFALPYNVEPSTDFKNNAGVVMTSAQTDSWYKGNAGKVIPAEGWWAFDVDMTVMRKHTFYNKDLEHALKISLMLFNQDNVWLDSILKGSLDGKLSGNLNLDALQKTFKSTSKDKVAMGFSDVIGSVSGLFMNTYFLKASFGETDPSGAKAAAIGAAVGVVGKLVGTIWGEETEEPDLDPKFGAIDGSVNLDLNATMTTAGDIRGERSNKVPNVEMSMGYFKEKDANGVPIRMGEGIWNILDHPVVYVVNDAYWYERHSNIFSRSTGFYLNDDTQKPVYAYYIAKDATTPGMRLISFIDPTSISGIEVNSDLFDGIEKVNILISYGVFPGSNPGYTNSFRKLAGLGELPYWHLSTDEKFETLNNPKFKMFKYKRDNPIFVPMKVENVFADVVANRLSSQLINGNIERRYYGQSAYYTKAQATASEVDQVQFVADPEIFVPFDTEKECLYDPVVPDFVVTVQLALTDRNDKRYLSTLRFVPDIKLISYKDVSSKAKAIKGNKDKMKAPSGVKVTYTNMEELIKRAEDFGSVTEKE
jgi:hypothetical protein